MFDPRLRTVPVIVLSNNDGCAIARTAEAKALGIRMGDPWFKIRDLCRREGVRVFSSNYALYGDMSARANSIYDRFAHAVEVYSIDESFLDVADVDPAHRVELGRDLRATVLAWTGLPTCVGIGPTKTLAKLANHLAKRHVEMGGVCDLTDPTYREPWLARTSLDEIWGIGPASQAKLRAMGCETVADVRDLDPKLARKGLTVVGERIIHELRGLPCLQLESVPATRKGCAVTRCFSGRVADRATVEQAVAAHASRLGEKLRRERLGTDHVGVFFHTSEHDAGAPQRSAAITMTLPEATSDTLVLVAAATAGVRQVWRAGYRYSKAGVVTVDLVRLEASQRALPGVGQADRAKAAALMMALDHCNARFGRGTVVVAAAGQPASRRGWATKFEMRSPRYTTRLAEVPVVSAGMPAAREARHADL